MLNNACATLLRLLSDYKRKYRDRRLIESHFDQEFYFSMYPDVAAAGGDPVDHYIRHGWREGRWPSGEFDTAWYLQTYPDVAASEQNPLAHYAEHGRLEGRLPVAPPTERTLFNVSRSADILLRFECIRKSNVGEVS